MRDPIRCLSCVHHYIKHGLIYCDIRKVFIHGNPEDVHGGNQNMW